MFDNRFFNKSIYFIKRRILFILHRLKGVGEIDDKLILFYSDTDYSDNSRVLYEYLLKNRPEYHYVWMLRKSDMPEERPKTEFVRLFNSVRSFSLLSKAKYVFHTHPIGNLFFPRKGQVVVNLWHGIPFKGIKGHVIKKKPPFDIMLCLGDNNIETTARFVGCDESYMRPWGYPRLDLLFSSRDVGKNNPFAPKDFSGKLILWMPTFRKSIASHLSEMTCDNETGLPLLTSVDKLAKFNSFLKTINIVVIVKIHHLQASKEAFNTSYSNLIFLQDKEIADKGYQLYEIVAKSDALLTDYSSVFADYLLMDRPMGFILDDLEAYKKSRGNFMFEPITDVLCGSHIHDYEQLKDFCKDISAGKDETIEFRNRIKKDMVKYPDGNNCKRLVEKLGI